ncbi:MAG: hypothetical protein NTX25_19515, partial [Proteobacteria bacterium]|nr:hypothetical protein [Pseudomonadota bacterium]
MKKSFKSLQAWLKKSPVRVDIQGLMLGTLCVCLASCQTSMPSESKELSQQKSSLRIVLVADMDRRAKTEQSIWRSYLKRGFLNYQPADSQHAEQWSLNWLDKNLGIELLTKFNDGARGAELSELVLFEDQLLAPCDRTGLVYEIQNPWAGLADASPSKTKGPSLALRYVLAGGDGSGTGGFKAEWAAIQNGDLYFGGHGREFTDGKDPPKIMTRDNLWIKRISKRDHRIAHIDWTEPFETLRSAAGLSFPGYLEHEAATFSEKKQEWLFLPRRYSKQAYDEEKNELRAWNQGIMMKTNLSSAELIDLGMDKIAERGFSSVKFVPGTNDQI